MGLVLQSARTYSDSVKIQAVLCRVSRSVCGLIGRKQDSVTRLNGTCFEFNTVSVTTNTKGSNHRKRGYVGKAEYFAVYLPDNGKAYMISVDEAPKGGGMTLRFKSAGLVRGNHKKTYTVPYEEINDPRFNWA